MPYSQIKTAPFGVDSHTGRVFDAVGNPMKKIGTASLFTILLCAGCSQPGDDKAQTDAINQRLDRLAQNQSLIISNQAVLSLRMDLLFAALPKGKNTDTLSDFYQTNSFAKLNQISSNIVASEQISAAGFDYVVYGISNAIANTVDLQSSVNRMQRDVSEIKSRLAH
jgi:PBP1b-binding outer membrane lipoprotein LpoB